MISHVTKLLFLLIFSAIVNTTIAQNIDITGPAGSERFGTVTALTNGNFVVVDADYDEGGVSNIGAVYLYNGSTLALISTLKGSSTNDRVGNFGGVIPLTNGNFVVSSINWSSGKGAITWVNGVTGLSGVVSSSNSVVGSVGGENIGYPDVFALPNGNYVAYSRYHNNMAGAATWGSGTTGVSGVLSAANSFVGANISTSILAVVILSNGNYVTQSANNGLGAVTWCNGTTGRVGSTVNSANSLVGSTANDYVGDKVIALSNGNYVVASPRWDRGAITDAGAVTWCNGATGRVGAVSTANSLTGSVANDQVGIGSVIALYNGNYVVGSDTWNNGVIADAGAATWGNGTSGTVGSVSVANSLIGSSANDNVGQAITALSNGNYIVKTSYWDNGAVADVGAITWCNGTLPTSAIVSSINSLIGSSVSDNIGNGGAVALSNGNYAIGSFNWDNGAITNAGAATWGNGTTGTTGVVSNTNSLIGSTINDQVGYNITALYNGNYVVKSPYWDNGAILDACAVTWCDGTTITSGIVSSGNSVTGSSAADNMGSGGVKALTNGNYVISSPFWDNGAINNVGAITWCNGTVSTAAVVSSTNSLIGSSADDNIGNTDVLPYSNGHYAVRSPNWDNGLITNAGAATICNGSTGLTGVITACNSVLGTAANGGSQITSPFRSYNYTHNYFIVGRRLDNIVTIFDASGMGLANDLDTRTVTIAGNNTVPLLSSNGCRIIATLTANGASPLSGSVNARAWVEPSVPVYAGEPFVARHYEITPATNASTSTGRVTLYFTQQEFTDFNDHPASALDLPSGPGDAFGIANVRIGKFGGTSNNGTGNPGTYSGAKEVINPDDADIVWKSSLSRWEVSFDVTGFSGFIVQTHTTVLPITLLEFNGHLHNNNAVLNWKTTGEYNMHSFDIERSTDGRTYATVGNVAALNQPGNNLYTFSDINITSLGASVYYYRIKQIDISGKFTYSGIVALSIDKSKNIVLFYPNPVITKANLTVTVNKPEQLVLNIFDNTGRLLQQQQLRLSAGGNVLPVDVKNLAKGVYYLELKGETINEHRSFVKQ